MKEKFGSEFIIFEQAEMHAENHILKLVANFNWYELERYLRDLRNLREANDLPLNDELKAIMSRVEEISRVVSLISTARYSKDTLADMLAL